MNKFLYFISWSAILGANLILLVLFYWYVKPYNLISFNSLPHRVINKEVRGGEYLHYVVDFCKYTKDVPIVTRYFKDDIIYSVPDIIASQNPLGCHANIVQLYVPKGLAPGAYVLELAYKYQVNPIRIITVFSQTEQFIVK